jgi:acetylornithine deacetylase/succinyl-diaminopimelate desuccinylase-like protein
MKHLVEQIDQSLDWHSLAVLARRVIEYGIAIQQIPAPTFHEATRANYVAELFASLHLVNIKTDDLHNVYGLLPGKKRHTSGILISAHTDTVFDQATNLQTQTEADRIYGPGLGDNSMGVAGMLGLIQFLNEQHITPEHDLWFVANSREEGLGDLGGMKVAFEALKPHIRCVINLEGMAFGHVYHAGIAVRRLHITANAEGGHSWLNFGRVSAIHGIVELGARITTMLRPPVNPRTTFNIGMIDGGQSINTIAAQASLWLDLRSEESATLSQFESEARALVETGARADLTFLIEVVGDRPAGSIAPEHPLVQGALAALAQVGQRGVLENGSTDANVPLAQGCPAVTVGITRGGNAHRIDEYIEIPPIAAGLRQLIILALAAAAYTE